MIVVLILYTLYIISNSQNLRHPSAVRPAPTARLTRNPGRVWHRACEFFGSIRGIRRRARATARRILRPHPRAILTVGFSQGRKAHELTGRVTSGHVRIGEISRDDE